MKYLFTNRESVKPSFSAIRRFTPHLKPFNPLDEQQNTNLITISKVHLLEVIQRGFMAHLCFIQP